MDVNVSEILERMAELFCVDPGGMKIDVINLRHNVHLKIQQHLWSSVEPDN